jgi:DNA primase
MSEYTDTLAEAERLKSAVSIAAVIGETLPLQRGGQHLVALCPFHNERTLSFTVYREHYHCFGCSAHGDVIDWLMTARRMDFTGAVQYLAGGARPDRIINAMIQAKQARECGGCRFF